MDRNIAKHLAKRGMHSTKPQKKDIPFSERNPDFFKWFKESVMGFDSEEYHREFSKKVAGRPEALKPTELGTPSGKCRTDSRNTIGAGIPGL